MSTRDQPLLPLSWQNRLRDGPAKIDNTVSKRKRYPTKSQSLSRKLGNTEEWNLLQEENIYLKECFWETRYHHKYLFY